MIFLIILLIFGAFSWYGYGLRMTELEADLKAAVFWAGAAIHRADNYEELVKEFESWVTQGELFQAFGDLEDKKGEVMKRKVRILRRILNDMEPRITQE